VQLPSALQVIPLAGDIIIRAGEHLTLQATPAVSLEVGQCQWQLRHRHCQATQLSVRVRSANKPDLTFHFNCARPGESEADVTQAGSGTL
jgi:hypothetical protein